MTPNHPPVLAATTVVLSKQKTLSLSVENGNGSHCKVFMAWRFLPRLVKLNPFAVLFGQFARFHTYSIHRFSGFVMGLAKTAKPRKFNG
jgi:hypothetical protein